MITTSVQTLLDVVEATRPLRDSQEWGSVSLPSPGGWTVVFFYDCGELDYVDEIISPDGESISIWELPQGDQRRILTYWDGPGSLERLRGWRIGDDGRAYDPQNIGCGEGERALGNYRPEVPEG